MHCNRSLGVNVFRDSCLLDVCRAKAGELSHAIKYGKSLETIENMGVSNKKGHFQHFFPPSTLVTAFYVIKRNV